MASIETELKELIETVLVACHPPECCNDPEVLKTYMRGCFDRAELARQRTEAK